jgi:hypothetical protein
MSQLRLCLLHCQLFEDDLAGMDASPLLFTSTPAKQDIGRFLVGSSGGSKNKTSSVGTLKPIDRKMDWESFCQTLTKLEMLLIESLVNGLGIREAAEIAKVNYSTMQKYRRKIAVKILEFMGAQILIEIALNPKWKIGLDCDRELMACRADRRN